MIGIDTVNIERLRTTFGRSPGIEARLFSHHERSYCRAKADPVMHFAGTLAAKEAVIKARGLGPLVAWSRRIEITRAPGGAPMASIAGAHDAPIHVSISHDGPVAVAVAIVPVSLVPIERHLVEPLPKKGGPKPNENLRRYLGADGTSPRLTQVGRLTTAAELVLGTDFP